MDRWTKVSLAAAILIALVGALVMALNNEPRYADYNKKARVGNSITSS